MSQFFLISALILAGLLPAIGVILGKRFSGEVSDEQVALEREEARALENKIIEVLATEDEWASKAQLALVRKRHQEYTSALQSQKDVRAGLETKLSTSHADVITRETAHQEVKAAKQEDEVALQEVVSSYHDISSESVSLERHLAESLKTIDKMSVEVSITDDQRAVFDALATSLTNASAQLRDVIIAHQNVYERLSALKAQYADLEGEYIKLVELQLGS